MSAVRRSPATGQARAGSCDFDLDRLAYGELTPEAEAEAREHLVGCDVCRREHEMLLLERRAFVARAWLASPAPLPDIEQLLARAASEPATLGLRWQTALRRWSSPWRGAILQSVLGALAVGLLLQVSHPRETVAPGASSHARPIASAADRSTRPSDEHALNRANPDSCDDFGEVCVDQPLVSTMMSMAALTDGGARSSDPCASGPQSQSADWSAQKSSSNELDSFVEAVCVPDAI